MLEMISPTSSSFHVDEKLLPVEKGGMDGPFFLPKDNMMEYLLHAADLGPEYWYFALTHAVYIKKGYQTLS